MMAGARAAASALLSICLLFSLFTPSFAQQTVQASNSSNDLPQPGTARYFLSAPRIGINGLRLVPLSHALEFPSDQQFSSFNVTGTLVAVGDDPTIVKQDDIAYISCDVSAYPGHLTADNTVMSTIATQSPPLGIILYSTNANHCNYSVSQNVHYDAIFTTIDPLLADNVETVLQKTASSLSAGNILPVPLSLQTSTTNSTSSGNSSNGSSSSSNNVLGPSPTTAVAMIILYSITGIITALFLVIIITGAIRAHRHPERYGPRNSLGRPRQSRAKGLARAMLETLPIVKFGDQEEERTKGPNGDNVELGENREHGDGVVGGEGVDGGKRPSTEVSAPSENADGQESDPDHPIAGASHPNDSHEDTTLGCSICTEDFTKGQDIRVLPCNHKFHPDCVDPWLLNVSGTCPLCRVDLRPTTSHTSGTGAEGAESLDTDPAPPLEDDSNAQGHAPTASRQRNSFFHSLRHLRDAPAEERLAALRTLHSTNQEAVSATDADRERRVSTRLRETFRIRTRRQGTEISASTAETHAPAAEREQTESTRPGPSVE